MVPLADLGARMFRCQRRPAVAGPVRGRPEVCSAGLNLPLGSTYGDRNEARGAATAPEERQAGAWSW